MKKKVSIRISGTQHYSHALSERISAEEIAKSIGTDALYKDGEIIITAEDADDTFKKILASIAERENSESMTTELFTDGTLSENDTGITIAYDETDVTGMAGSHTMLHITGDTVTLSRYGKVNTHMAFERGKRFICAYPLGDGKFDEAAYLSGIAPITHFPTVCVTTKALENNIGAEGGNMLIDYLVEIGGNTAEHNEYHITVRPV